jgi:oxygen-independent coproporphyrinogen-3 oxidase
MQDFQRAGVNRLSMGVQSLNDDALRLFGRDHAASEALLAIEKIKPLFKNFSLDFIYGRPNQTLEQWREELERIVNLGAPHLSLYNLMLERGTPLFKDVTAKKLVMPDTDLSADMYELTVEVT